MYLSRLKAKICGTPCGGNSCEAGCGTACGSTVIPPAVKELPKDMPKEMPKVDPKKKVPQVNLNTTPIVAPPINPTAPKSLDLGPIPF
jgi:hypothetical protein